MNKSFVVVGLFRSGTLFLARTLNLSPTWTVKQEAKVDKGLRPLQKRLNRDHYGEVNMYATRHINDIVVPKKAVIVRDVGKVMLSYFNKRWKSECKRVGRPGAKKFMQKTIDGVNIKLNAMDGAIENGMRLIQFTKMTTDVGYLRGIAKHLGVTDVPWDKVDITRKINARAKHFDSLKETPSWFQDAVEDMKWFTDKWVEA
tara:strand:+ start:93 stop:695 length:603 start_codon:yes stop_codon:yes gene_type:complete